MRKMLFISFALLLLLPAFAAAENYYSVDVDKVQYSLLPGDTVEVSFLLSNKELLYPKNVTVFIDPCPVGWKCQRRTLSFSSEGNYPVNLTVEVPKTAQPKKYTLYVLLESEWQTRRGYDRIVLNVMTPEQAKAISYEQYTAEKEEPEPEPELWTEPVAEQADEPEPEPVLAEVEEEVVPAEEQGLVDAIVPDINRTEIAENVERMESSHQFVEYASVVLIVVLVFIAAGAYRALRKEK
ncbi:hypothetical protein KY359_05315 [Candidatus Woesearchaeota archaeon]|nr:hypothetical protein [Candidatus Woesearchaeota archaeon]